MKSKRSWKWLAPRLIGRQVRKKGRPTAAFRPCLVVESLEDRLTMSATTIGEPPPTSDQVGEQVVVDLLQAGAKLTTDEIGLLNTIANPPTPEGSGPPISDIHISKDLDKASTTLFQLNDTLNKLGDAVIKGQLTDHKLAAAEQKIEFLKIKLEDIIITSLNVSQEQAEAIVQPLIDDAEALKAQLTDLNTASLVAHRKAGKGQQEFLKLDANIMKLEDLAIKMKVDTLEGKAANPGLTEQVSLNFSKIKVEYQEQKLDQDQAAVSALNNFQATLFPDLGGGGNFDGGVTIAPTTKTAS